MADMKDIVKLAVDCHRGSVEKYSVDKSQEVLREALIEANGGSTVLNYRNIRDGKCNGLFALIEELLSAIIVDDLQGDEFFNTMVDFRNVAEGDQNLFLVEDSTLFAVAEIARGTQGICRQRHPGVNEVPIPTTTKAVRIYEELSRVLSGRVDFNKMIERVGISFRKSMLGEIYALWAGLTADDLGGTVYFPAAGSYDADTLLDVIAHVEAAAGGKPAKIVGTKKALRNLIEAVQSNEAKDELHNLGLTA